MRLILLFLDYRIKTKDNMYTAKWCLEENLWPCYGTATNESKLSMYSTEIGRKKYTHAHAYTQTG